MIEHLVFSGTNAYLLQMFGAAKYLYENNYWNIKNIKSIHATSGGAILALLWQLNLDWKDVEDYLIKRPWENLFNITPEILFAAYSKRGLFDITLFKKFIEPIFKLKDIDMSITLQDLFEKTNICFNIYATELNNFEKVCFSHEKTPTVRIIDAIYYSFSIPPVFQPTIIDDKCYLDGAIFSHYPLDSACEVIEDKDTILAFNLRTVHYVEQKKLNNITEKTNIYGYFTDIIFSIIRKTIHKKPKYNIKNEFFFRDYIIDKDPDDPDATTSLIGLWKTILSSQEKRKEMILFGEKDGEIFMKNNLNPES